MAWQGETGRWAMEMGFHISDASALELSEGDVESALLCCSWTARWADVLDRRLLSMAGLGMDRAYHICYLG